MTAQAIRAPKASVLQKSQDRTKTAFLLPAYLWVLVFTILPGLFTLFVMFWNVKLGRPWEFIGLKNLERVFTDKNLHTAAGVTLTIAASTVTIEMLLGFGLAMLLNREIIGRKFLRTLMILPLFATPVAVGYLGITIFYEEGGPMNSFLGMFGIAPVAWLSSGGPALLAVILVDVWQWTPFVFLVSLAGLQSLPQEVYEAAAVDGAGGWSKFALITLPLMQPTLVLILLLRLIESFKVFDIPASMTLGGPGRATEVYGLFMHRTALKFFDLGYAAAQGFVLLIVVSTLVGILFRRIRDAYK